MLDDMMAVYERKKGHKLIFQPRLRHWYDVNYNAGTLPERYKGKYLEEVYKDLGITPREVWGTRRLGSEHGGYFSLDIVDGDDIKIWTRRMRGYKGKSEHSSVRQKVRPWRGARPKRWGQAGSWNRFDKLTTDWV